MVFGSYVFSGPPFAKRERYPGLSTMGGGVKILPDRLRMPLNAVRKFGLHARRLLGETRRHDALSAASTARSLAGG